MKKLLQFIIALVVFGGSSYYTYLHPDAMPITCFAIVPSLLLMVYRAADYFGVLDTDWR